MPLKKHETDALWNNGVKEKVPENAMLAIAVLPDLIVQSPCLVSSHFVKSALLEFKMTSFIIEESWCSYGCSKLVTYPKTTLSQLIINSSVFKIYFIKYK